jgi:hypothetical protein
MSLRRRISRVRNRLLYGMPDRYGHLSAEIKRYHCLRILEIGTWDGTHAIQMIRAAMKAASPKNVEYYGFDLFEGDPQSRNDPKPPVSLALVNERMKPMAELGVSVKLHKGDTRVVLPSMLDQLPKMDFIFIDGGHSFDIVQSDWRCARRLMGKNSVVIFDDYVNREAVLHLDFGVNRIIDGLNQDEFRISFLNPVDSFPYPWGTLQTRFAKVSLR